jgi:nucleotide-binding universal stress UspA family protein
MIFVALLSKYLASYATKLLYRYNKAEQLLLFGLSSSHAAATIAVVIVGYRMGIFNEHIINGIVLIILFTCLASTYITDYAGRMVALQHEGRNVQKSKSEHVLVPVANPETATSLFNFAIMIHQTNNDSKISPLTIATTPKQLEQSILHDPLLKTQLIHQARTANVQYQPVMRIDSNISEGIIRTAAEIQATHIVLGWSGLSSTSQYFFGTIIEKLLVNCPQTIVVANLRTNNVMFRKIYVLIPQNADHEMGFHVWMLLLLTLQNKSSGELHFFTDKDTLNGVIRMTKNISFQEKNIYFFAEIPNMKSIAGELTKNDLLVVISARQNTVSYSRKLAVMPRVVTRYFGHTNNMILYPE